MLEQEVKAAQELRLGVGSARSWNVESWKGAALDGVVSVGLQSHTGAWSHPQECGVLCGQWELSGFEAVEGHIQSSLEIGPMAGASRWSFLLLL